MKNSFHLLLVLLHQVLDFRLEKISKVIELACFFSNTKHNQKISSLMHLTNVWRNFTIYFQFPHAFVGNSVVLLTDVLVGFS